MPTDDLAKCNVSSIAAATGLNRETTRRKVDQLVRLGLVVKEKGAIQLRPGATQQAIVCEAVKVQLDELRRAANDFLRMGALELKEP
jgi:DNA-binding IclR family transcriptional regulator